MFFSPDRINVVRRMILAQTKEQRQKALDELLPFQRLDFEVCLVAVIVVILVIIVVSSDFILVFVVLLL